MLYKKKEGTPHRMNKLFTATKIFYSLITVFILLLAFFIIPDFPFKNTLFPLVAVFGLLFLILGITLTILARKEKGKLKLFLLITGISATFPLIFSILHNLFYALAITFVDFKYFFELLHAGSFIIALLIAPITFIIGAIGTILSFEKNTDYLQRRMD